MESRAKDNEDTDDPLIISIITNSTRIMFLWLLSALLRPFPRIRRDWIIHTRDYVSLETGPRNAVPRFCHAERAAVAFHIKYSDAGKGRDGKREGGGGGWGCARGVTGCTGSCAVTILYRRHEATRPRRALVRETLISCPLIPLKLVAFKLEISVRTIQFPEQRQLKRTRVVALLARRGYVPAAPATACRVRLPVHGVPESACLSAWQYRGTALGRRMQSTWK